MSEQDKNNGSNQEVAEAQATEQNDFVRKQAYEEVSRDMHKFKNRLKEEAARAAEYEARLKALEEEKLIEQKKFEELYQREKKQREQAESARNQEKNLYLRAVKLSALKAELGNVKDVYLSHADIDGIEIREDGSLSSESVKAVADKFRQEHPTLIPKQSGSNITNPASPTSFGATSNEKPLSKMSFEEKAAMLKSLKNQS